ncbi:hypothetical protein JVT61DRAFT_9031 [Boletus reticuloceps]|uniref:Uncharacterized protein n=1 Tax=Boletus reticuloceps TaxID=495285 RepID=A0A8I3A6P0_9AGAM|nr:hypothetical protein JVT61DRAFT_9031 [Boletus reticuloceps]
MSDLFFPNNSSPQEKMQLILSMHYLPDPTPRKELFSVMVYSASGEGVVDTPAIVPAFYHDHLCRFLWRHSVYMELVSQDDITLMPKLRPLLERYIFYMDAVVEGLLTTARNKTFTKDPTFCSILFNQYLVVEYHVGHHEFNVIGAWRQRNPDIILECMMLDDIDFDSFYKKADKANSAWSGSRYKFMYNKVTGPEWQILADLAAKHFGIDNYNMRLISFGCPAVAGSKKKKGKGKGKAQVAAHAGWFPSFFTDHI